MASGPSRGFCSTVYKSVNNLEAVADEHTISNKKVAVKEAQAYKGTIYEIFYFNQFLQGIKEQFSEMSKTLLKYLQANRPKMRTSFFFFNFFVA